MANCCEMKEGDVYVCEVCELELKVSKGCKCESGSDDACTEPLSCCGKNLTKTEKE